MRTNKAMAAILGRMNLPSSVYHHMMVEYTKSLNETEGFVLVRHGDGKISVKTETQMNSFDIVTAMGDSPDCLDYH